MSDKSKKDTSVRKVILNTVEQIKNGQSKAAYQVMAEELFQDYYKRRKDVYKMNFFRGIFFGLGSVIGGTVVVALIIWLLTLFVDIPGIGDYVKDIRSSVERN